MSYTYVRSYLHILYAMSNVVRIFTWSAEADLYITHSHIIHPLPFQPPPPFPKALQKSHRHHSLLGGKSGITPPKYVPFSLKNI